ncbi:hypothetical protein C8F01DRAFT_1086843 [Mycena amicta]|nr:hypothetical protein C8F01DRAFT_1086843 [Mycena amicta]
MTSPRRIYVDDTDASIQYGTNQWFPHDVTQLNTLGNLGTVWNGTTQSTSTNGATLNFAFSGTSISLLGTIQTAIDAEGNVDPTWTCLVDEIAISNGSDPTFKFPENNWILCDQPTLLAGPHTLKVKVQTKGQPFYVDSFIYTPTPDVSIDGAVLEYTAGDEAISYGTGWQFYTVENTENITQTKGAQVAINFHGTAVKLTGYVPMELPHNATTAKYVVDNGPATTFALQGLPAEATTTPFNVLMFAVDSLSPADHNVVVTYEGDSTKTPLVVKTFFSLHRPRAHLPRPPSHSSGTHTGAKKHSPAAAIAGGVVAGLVGLAVLAGLLFWCLRRRRRGKTPKRSSEFTIDKADVPAGPGTTALAFSSAARSQDHFDPYAESQRHVPTASQTTTYPYPYSPLRRPNAASASNEYSSLAASAPSSSSGTRGVHGASKAQELAPQRRVVVQRHQDSGVRLNSTPSLLLSQPPEIVELPPDYSRD